MLGKCGPARCASLAPKEATVVTAGPGADVAHLGGVHPAVVTDLCFYWHSAVPLR